MKQCESCGKNITHKNLARHIRTCKRATLCKLDSLQKHVYTLESEMMVRLGTAGVRCTSLVPYLNSQNSADTTSKDSILLTHSKAAETTEADETRFRIDMSNLPTSGIVLFGKGQMATDHITSNVIDDIISNPIEAAGHFIKRLYYDPNVPQNRCVIYCPPCQQHRKGEYLVAVKDHIGGGVTWTPLFTDALSHMAREARAKLDNYVASGNANTRGSRYTSYMKHVMTSEHKSKLACKADIMYIARIIRENATVPLR